MLDDKRLLAMATEFNSVLQTMHREGNTLSATLRDAWDGVPLQTMTKNAPAVATAAHVSVIAHCTTAEVSANLSSIDAASGFGNRFLWAMSRRSKMLPRGGSLRDEDLDPLVSRLVSAVEAARTRDEVGLDNEAADLWASVYPSLSDDRPGLVGALTARAESQTLRLALIYALLDSDDMIRLPHLEAALEVWRYCFASVVYVYGEKLGDRLADDIMDLLRQERNGMAKADISEEVAGHHDAGQVDRALAMLESQGMVEKRKEATSGRPRTVYAATGRSPFEPFSRNPESRKPAQSSFSPDAPSRKPASNGFSPINPFSPTPNQVVSDHLEGPEGHSQHPNGVGEKGEMREKRNRAGFSDTPSGEKHNHAGLRDSPSGESDLLARVQAAYDRLLDAKQHPSAAAIANQLHLSPDEVMRALVELAKNAKGEA